jgi:hypothetical protein
MWEGRSFQPLELLSDCVEDRNLRAVLVGMLPGAGLGSPRTFGRTGASVAAGQADHQVEHKDSSTSLSQADLR